MGKSQICILHPANSQENKQDLVVESAQLSVIVSISLWMLADIKMHCIVAIHGLMGDHEKTWTHKQNNRSWLRDFLPNHVPDIRVMAVSYNADIAFSTQYNEIKDQADGLLSMLNNKRESKEVSINCRNIHRWPHLGAGGKHDSATFHSMAALTPMLR